MPLLALKVDVDTLIGTERGVPKLVEILQRHRAWATFLFSLGPDRTGRAIRRVFRRGFLDKVGRTSVLSHYGLRTLLYGTLLPAPDIGERGAAIMQAVREAGFEVGIHCYDHVRWQDNAAKADALWTQHEMRLAYERFAQIFRTQAKVHGAAGWQMNVHALRLARDLDFDYCSDSRGTRPFLPVCDGEPIECPQLPTTLPTLDEMIGVGGAQPDTVVQQLLERTARPPAQGHVFTLHAELEGGKLAPQFERLLKGWRDQGYELVSLRRLFQTLEIAALPQCETQLAAVPGRSGTLLCQGRSLAPVQ